MACCASNSFFILILDKESAEIFVPVDGLVIWLAVSFSEVFVTTCAISFWVVTIAVSTEVFSIVVVVVTSFVFSTCVGDTIAFSFVASTIE